MFERRKILLSTFLLLIAFSYVAASDLKLPYSGRYGAIFRYTPENKFEAGFNLIANSGFMVKDQGLNLNVSIGSIWPGVGQINIPFPSQSFNVPYYLSTITVKTVNPLIKSNNSGTLSIGSVQARYSPLVMMISTSAENPLRDGIAIDGVKLGKLVLDGVWVWKNDLDAPTLGCRVTYKEPKYTYTGILSQNFLYSPVSVSFDTEERVISSELVYRIKSGTVAITTAAQEKKEETKQIKQVILNHKLPNNIGLKITYRDFEPGYRPIYSDRTARVQKSGARRGWNLLDQYGSCKGTAVNLDGKYNKLSYKITKESHTNRDYFRDQSLRPGIISSEEILVEGSPFGIQSKLLVKHTSKNIANDFGNNIFLDTSSVWGRLSKQSISKQVIYNHSLGFWKDNGVELLDREDMVVGTITEKGGEYLVSGRLRNGLFRGLTLQAGLKAISVPQSKTYLYKSIGAEYQTRNGIEFLFRFTTPNFEEYEQYYAPPYGTRPKYDTNVYDRYMEKVLLDNVFEMKYTISY